VAERAKESPRIGTRIAEENQPAVLMVGAVSKSKIRCFNLADPLFELSWCLIS
jgi:hypothetical protein